MRLTLESDLPYFKIRALTLSLEQYYIFTLNPSLNVVKVAGSQPLVKHSEEHINRIVSANSKPVYVYKDNILVYEAKSASELIKKINISQSTITKCFNDPEYKVLNSLIISHKEPSSNIIINN